MDVQAAEHRADPIVAIAKLPNTKPHGAPASST
jgi:hypothetical protein